MKFLTPPSSPDLAPSPAAWCDRAVEALVAFLLATMPFALGVVAPWSEDAVVAAACLIATCLALRAWLLRGHDTALAWALAPVALFLAVAAAQLLPLPAALVGAASPGTLATKRPLLQDLPNAAAVLGRVTLSFYPSATRHDLRLVLVCTVMFLATLQVFRREEQYRRLLWTIVLSGGAAAALALLQDLSGTDKIYWLIPTPRGLANAGPFVGYSNYSQYVNLCIGAALGLLLYSLRRDPHAPTVPDAASAPADRWSARRRRSPESGKSSGSGRSGRRSRSGWDVQPLKSWPAWLLMAVMALAGATLFLSLSRGGMMALLCAAGLTVLLLARRGGMRNAAWALMLLMLVAFGVLLYAGFDAVCERLASLHNAKDPSAGRFQTYSDILLAWRKFPLFGTGLGTHEYVYPMFDRSSDPGLADFADSDYFQALEETGAIGLSLVLGFAAFVWVSYARAIRRGGPRTGALAWGLGFGLLAVMLQSLTDFGQHLPAIGCISAVFCGMLVNLGRAATQARHPASPLAASRRSPAASTAAPDPAAPPDYAATAPPEVSPPRPTLPAFLSRLAPLAPLASLAAPAALLLATGWALSGAESARQSQSAADRASALAERLEQTGWKAGDADFAQLIREASAAVSADPSNVKARYSLACYRWRAISRSAEAEAPAPDDSAPEGTEPAAGPPGIALPPDAPARARQVVDELNLARAACPTYGPAWAVAGQIERMVLGDPAGSAHVRTAFALAPAQPEVCLAAAQLDVAEGRFAESLTKARRGMALDASLVPQVVEMYLHGAARPDLAVEAVGDDPERMFNLYYQMRDEEPAGAPHRAAAMASARARLRTLCDRPAAPPWTMVSLAGLLAEEKEFAPAIELYRRALQKEYGQADWHLGLASILAHSGQKAEAAHQAEICLHLQPRMEAARLLIREINQPAGARLPLDPHPGDTPAGDPGAGDPGPGAPEQQGSTSDEMRTGR